MEDRQRWSGDGEFVLPAGFVEPYRLWFEYLKSAYADETIEVDKAHYAPWGDVANLTFINGGGKTGGPSLRSKREKSASRMAMPNPNLIVCCCGFPCQVRPKR